MVFEYDCDNLSHERNFLHKVLKLPVGIPKREEIVLSGCPTTARGPHERWLTSRKSSTSQVILTLYLAMPSHPPVIIRTGASQGLGLAVMRKTLKTA